MKRALGALVAAALLAAPLEAQTVLRLASRQRPYHERFDQRTVAHGGVVLGVQLQHTTGAPLDPGNVTVYAPPLRAEADLLCVEITTSGGHYWSRNSYELAAAPGWTLLEAPSAHRGALERFKAPAFAVRAELRRRTAGSGEDACGRPLGSHPVLLVAGVGRQARWPAPITLLINSKATPARATVTGPGGQATTSTCTPLDALLAVAYDAACDLSLPPPGRGQYGLELRLADPGGAPEVHRAVLSVP